MLSSVVIRDTYMPRAKKNDNRADDLKWGEIKTSKTFLLTPTASDILDDAAEKLGTTRSEALEQLIRFGGPFAPNFQNPSPSTSNGSKGGKSSSKVVQRMQMLQPSLFSPGS